MQITIHIGLPKCASSSLQAFFADNGIRFRSAGVLYPTTHRMQKGYRHHGPLLQPELDPVNAANSILQEAKQHGCHHILLSAEQFSSNRSGRLAAIAGTFADRLGQDAVSCLCLVRDPVAMLHSSYQQFVKAGLWGIDRKTFYQTTDGSIDAYIQAFHTLRGCHWFEYDRLISLAMKAVPARKLTVWDLDKIPDLATQLTAHFGLPTTEAASVKNTRLTFAKILFLRRFQQEFGQAIYNRNRPALIRKIDLTGAPCSPEQAIASGISLAATDLAERFPQMQAHRVAAMALSGTWPR